MRDALNDALNGPSYETICRANAAFDRMAEWKDANRALVEEQEALIDRSDAVARELSYHILGMDTPDEEIVRMRAEYRAISRRLEELKAVLDPSFTAWMEEVEAP